ncbi:MAG: sigma 54-interacting transcriptional regulator, partial [candidate division WOR-3 bacterium]
MLKSDTLSMAADEYLIGKSSAIREICEMIEKVAATDATVLITGETGVGKGLVARLIHSKSARHKENFVVFSCGSLPESLVESELF